jgi:hypothetical protein
MVKSCLESVAHLAIVTLLTLSVTSNGIWLFGGTGFSLSDNADIFLLLSVSSGLGLVVLTILLKIAGSEHRRFSFRAMLVARGCHALCGSRL